MLRTIRSKYNSAGTIMRLPVFEEDEDPARREVMTDEEIYASRKPPTTIVVRYGAMKMVAEYPYDGPAKPGCGSKLIARTNRGLEVAEMLTTTCPNAGCGKSVTRKEMLGYIENSGGEEYPFRTDGKILRVASVSDLNRWSGIQAETRGQVSAVKTAIVEVGLDDQMRLVDLEPILSEEQLTVFYLAEDRIDFRELVHKLARMFGCRIEMRQVGARDEARLVADYERCGQHCCCQNFLKVLKPVSMRSAKTQKATLDPLKISGRCGRLMCCLRYEDETYAELKARLPHKKTRVGTPEGPGIVVDSKILVQLVLVKLEADAREIAVPVEELCDPDIPVEAKEPVAPDPLRGMPVQEKAPTQSRQGQGQGQEQGKNRRRRRRRKGKGEAKDQQDAFREASQAEDQVPGSAADSGALAPGEKPPKRKRRRRKRGRAGSPDNSAASGGATPGGAASDAKPAPKKKKKRRRRRKRHGGGPGGTSAPSSE